MYARAPSAVQVIVAQANRNAGRLYRRAGGTTLIAATRAGSQGLSAAVT
jgi:hypothetical protein